MTNSWIQTEGNEAQKALIASVARHFTADQQVYLMETVREVKFYHFAGSKAGLGGYYNPSKKYIGINTNDSEDHLAGVARPQQIGGNEATAVHELTHPLLRLAAANSPGGYFILSPDLRTRLRDNARAEAPEAVAAMDEALNNVNGSTFHNLNLLKFGDKGVVCALAYMFCDDRYYDRFGEATYAKYTGIGYTTPARDHEVGCNIKALMSSDRAIRTGMTKIAEELLTNMEEKIEKALKNTRSTTIRRSIPNSSSSSLNERPERRPFTGSDYAGTGTGAAFLSR